MLTWVQAVFGDRVFRSLIEEKGHHNSLAITSYASHEEAKPRLETVVTKAWGDRKEEH